MSPQQFTQEITDLDNKLTRLKALYDQYFQGYERREPSIARKDVERGFQRLMKERPNNTALRFKFNNLRQRFVTLQSYWKRITREIEEGTYRRDIDRLKRKKKKQQAEPVVRPRLQVDLAKEFSEFKSSDVDGALDAFDAAKMASLKPGAPVAMLSKRPPAEQAKPARIALGVKTKAAAAVALVAQPKVAVPKKVVAKKPAGPPPPPPKRKAPPPPPPRQDVRGVPNARMRALYDDYVDARRREGKTTTNVRYEKLVASVERMMPTLEKKHGSRGAVDFKVVVKEGKVGIQPVAKKKKG